MHHFVGFCLTEKIREPSRNKTAAEQKKLFNKLRDIDYYQNML